MRKRIVVSMLVIALAAALLGGAAFAWFTDEDSVTANFTAGTLDVALEAVALPIEFGNLAPGYETDAASPWNITIKNTGTLDMYYRVYFTGTDTPATGGGKLSEVLLVEVKVGETNIIGFADGVTLNDLIINQNTIFDDLSDNIITAETGTVAFSLRFQLPTIVGNEHQGASFNGTLVVQATQVDNNPAPSWTE